MNYSEDIRNVARRMLPLSKKGGVHWEFDDMGVADSESAVFYQAWLGGHLIRCGMATFEAKVDRYYFRVNPNGDMDPNFGGFFGDEDTEDGDLLRILYESAARFVSGYDRVLNDIDRAINELNVNQDDIPF